MLQVIDIEAASRAVFSHMKPGVIANRAMKPDEYHTEISGGNLYAHEWDGGLLFLRKKKGRHLLTFLIKDLESYPGIDLPEDTVMEIPQKTTQPNKAAEYWARNGFNTAFERIRLTRPVGEASAAAYDAGVGVDIFPAMAENYEDVRALLWGSFDHRTGCLPDDDELKESIKRGEVLIVKVANSVGGVLRAIEKLASAEIRQLAVREDLRGTGLSHKLVRAFTARFAGKKQIVWVRDGYTAAIKTYTATGFAPDGRRSIVMTRKA